MEVNLVTQQTLELATFSSKLPYTYLIEIGKAYNLFFFALL